MSGCRIFGTHWVHNVLDSVLLYHGVRDVVGLV